MNMPWEIGRDELAALLRRAALEAGERTPGTYLFQGRSGVDVRQAINGDPAYVDLLEEIQAEGDRLLREPISELSYGLFRIYETVGTRVEYERPYFERRKRLTATVLLSWLEPANRILREAAAEIIWAICDEYTWCLPAHLTGSEETNTDDRRVRSLYAEDPRVQVDLFAAETAFALSEAAALLGPLLPPLLHKRIVQEVFGRALRPFVSQRAQPFHWERSRMNWASVCAGSLGAAAIYMLDHAEQSDELADVLVHVLPVLRSFLLGYEPDGACKEGYGYWQYGFGYYVYFADLLRQRTGGALDLFALDGIGAIARFSQASFLDGRLVANFSDAHPEYGVYMGLAHYLLGEYPGRFASPAAELRAAHAADHCGRWAPAVRNLIWFQPERAAGEPWPAGSTYLPDAQWLVSRVEASVGERRRPQPQRFAFAAKGGHNNEPHNQNDLGQFILYGAGHTFLADLGSGRYTREYFRPETRYGILCNGSQGHSVPIVNGRFQEPGADYRAVVLEASLTDEADRFTLDLAGAYACPSLQRLERTFTWRKSERPELVLEDAYRFSAPPESVVERFITYDAPRLDEAGEGVVTLRGAGSQGNFNLQSSDHPQLRIQFDPAAVRPVVTELVHVDHHGAEVPVYALDFSALAPGSDWSVRFVFRFADS